MTVRAVADTHTVLWYLYNDARLSEVAGKVIDGAYAAGDQIAISSIALVEIVYLSPSHYPGPQDQSVGGRYDLVGPPR